MVAGSILPIAIHNGELHFLFGQELPIDDTPGWSDFGGGVENNESPYETAMREGGEELTGFLGDGNMIKKMIKKNGGLYKLTHKTKSDYVIHMFLTDYDANLPRYYNQSHQFLWDRMDHHFLHETKLFEKMKIDWFTQKDMKKKRAEFRSFYQEIVDHILEEMPKIEQFIRSRPKGKTSVRTTRKRHI